MYDYIFIGIFAIVVFFCLLYYPIKQLYHGIAKRGIHSRKRLSVFKYGNKYIKIFPEKLGCTCCMYHGNPDELHCLRTDKDRLITGRCSANARKENEGIIFALTTKHQYEKSRNRRSH